MRTASLTSALILALAVPAIADATKLTSYPSGWDTSKAGSALPASAITKTAAYTVSWMSSGPTDVCADGVVGCKLYAPIHSQLGTAPMAQATNRTAITTSSAALALKTLNPSSSGKGGTDVNVETMDSHGHGFSFSNGYIEAVVALPTAHGSHSGFWLLNVQTSQGHGEIDFPETYGAADDTAASAVHWWPTAASRFASQVSVGHYWSALKPTTIYGTYHRWGVLLTPTTICTYQDRKQVGCIARLTEADGPVYALLSVFTDGNRKDGYQPAVLQVQSLTAWGK